MNIKITKRISIGARFLRKGEGYGSRIAGIDWFDHKAYVRSVGEPIVEWPPRPSFVVRIRGFRILGLMVRLVIKELGLQGAHA